MIIDYIERKKINWENIKGFLKDSEISNCYANNGPTKKLLEKELVKLLKLKNKKVITVNNGTSALHLLLLFYQYKTDKKIKFLSPSFTFPSVIVNNDIVEIQDINQKSLTLELPDENSQYDGFILTNLFGVPILNIDKWIDYCNEFNKILIFDNASYFSGNSMFEFAIKRGFKLKYSANYYPQGNGLV